MPREGWEALSMKKQDMDIIRNLQETSGYVSCRAVVLDAIKKVIPNGGFHG